MKKSEFIDHLSKAASLSKKDTENFTDAFLETIVKVLQKKDEISFKGFGSFKPLKRVARTGRNVRTGEPLKIPASITPKFTPSKVFKELLNKK